MECKLQIDKIHVVIMGYLVLQLSNFDVLAIRGLQSFAGVDEPINVFRFRFQGIHFQSLSY
jgi:hypothetical protein